MKLWSVLTALFTLLLLLGFGGQVNFASSTLGEMMSAEDHQAMDCEGSDCEPMSQVCALHCLVAATDSSAVPVLPATIFFALVAMSLLIVSPQVAASDFKKFSTRPFRDVKLLLTVCQRE